MKPETLTAAAMQTDDKEHQRDLLDLVTLLDQIQRRIFCPIKSCKKVMDIRKSVLVIPKACGLSVNKESKGLGFCSDKCASAAMERLRADFINDVCTFRTVTPANFKQTFPHKRLRPEMPDHQRATRFLLDQQRANNQS